MYQCVAFTSPDMAATCSFGSQGLVCFIELSQRCKCLAAHFESNACTGKDIQFKASSSSSLKLEKVEKEELRKVLYLDEEGLSNMHAKGF
ncbi:dehydration-responsive element-binding protein 1B-like [Pyrus ussuriensis x Pyrus communis]|uniref:Dehydration-responsive element-binding protein 1B-like n=1 Tax=Pyrus ussuriensis x Pyrus communis TaxID=2448454 RepID=A0A5N5HUQ4_9ROSA|nr:dehydration-responsive element-binding protein 1B-like [Pyrus ussuriensis x Pyrus communis]